MNRTRAFSRGFWILLITTTFMLLVSNPVIRGQGLPLSPKAMSSWTASGDGSFEIIANDAPSDLKGESPAYKLYWRAGSNASAGSLRSPVFRIEKSIQEFSIAGISGLTAERQWGMIRLRLKASGKGEILRESTTNGYAHLSTERWYTPDLLGKEVYLEVYAPALTNYWGYPEIWVGLGDYRQVDPSEKMDAVEMHLQGIKLDEKAQLTYCRSLPFLSVNPAIRGETSRSFDEGTEILPVNAQADVIYLLGLINQGWENGVAHWGEHPEILEERQDQVYIGKRLGTLVIQYEQGVTDSIPLVPGSTMWFSNHWAHGASHGVSVPSREPFASRQDYMNELRNTLLVREDGYDASNASNHRQFYLALRPGTEKITSIALIDEPGTRGRPLVTAITLRGKKQKGLHQFGEVTVEREDAEPRLNLTDPPDYYRDAAKIASILYTSDHDLPVDPEPVTIPEDLQATSIRFLGGPEAGWLSNVWAANLVQIHEKFDPVTGYFMETGEDCPWYGGYSGLGTWCVQGIYPAAYSRTSDHYATLAMRHINLPQREASFVDFCDSWLYFFRDNHDPAKGPPNAKMDTTRYPADAPPHWSMELSNPPTADGMFDINEIYGDEEMDGHAATIVARWYAWRLQGGSKGEWLHAPRDGVYGKSRWESTRDATEFITWLMDYSGRDLVYSEGEFTGWGGISAGYILIPEGMMDEKDPEKIRQNYANANMYEPYPNFACMVALECAAEMADAAGEPGDAGRWRQYAETIRKGMIRQLTAGDFNKLTWRMSPYSILTTFQDRLVQAWFSQYYEGLDPVKWDQKMLEITRNTFHEHMDMPYGHAPVLAMGYGQGWLTHASLVLDEMDHAGKLLVNTARYTYDKNMDFADPQKGIDWRKWMWIVPEGVNLLPDGSWHRINDLSNGANQGPVMHALEAAAGVDDTDPAAICIMPRIPEPLKGIAVEEHSVLVPRDGGLIKGFISYTYEKGKSFTMESTLAIPDLAIRIGPWPNKGEADQVSEFIRGEGLDSRLENSGSYKGNPAWWIWIEKLENIKDLAFDLVP